ncbi:hypothetical protein B0H11DRAFT_2290284 [Mycena galericulata]|nr:hypothetical protein B0H11DRAFT_2290284 [Mycena galericulata]
MTGAKSIGKKIEASEGKSTMQPSPFDDILYTNAVPSDAECQRIHDLLVGPQKKAAVLAQEVVRVQSLLDELTAKRDQLNAFIDAHLALVSPVRRLPDDVVREIFVAALPSDRNAIMSEEEAPLLLSHISQGWRNLALSTPRLWSTLHIVTPPVSSVQSHIPKLHQINGAVVTWLSRSGTLPVSISFIAPRPYLSRGASEDEISALPEATRSASFTLIQTLIEFCTRWRSIRFKMPDDSYLTPLAALSVSDVPKLSSIEMNMGGGDADWASMSFLGTPSLRAVSLGGGAHTSPTSWDTLAHLSIRFMGVTLSLDETLSMLRHCTNLETLHLTSSHNQPHGQTHAQPCHLAQLWRLSLISVGNISFLQQLSAPNLRILEFHGPFDSASPSPLLTLISSSDRLEHLRLSVHNITVDSLIEMLQKAPALGELALVADPILPPPPHFGPWGPTGTPDGRLLSLLDSTLCPRLQQLTLLQFNALSDDALLAFVQTRTDPSLDRCARLSRVNAHFARARQVDIIPSLQQSIADGLEIRLDYAAQSHASPLYSVVEDRQPYDQWDSMAPLWDIDNARVFYGW